MIEVRIIMKVAGMGIQNQEAQTGIIIVTKWINQTRLGQKGL